jgi:hypothetical protein
VKPVGFLERVDDLLNPIVVKELRQAVQSKIVIAALSLYLVLQLGILGIILVLSEVRQASLGDLHAGREIFLVLQGILVGTCLVLIPAYAGVRLAAERSDTNVDLLFISTLRPRAIIAGKFQAAVILVLLIFSACAPFMTFTYLLRGIDIPTILIVLAMDFLAVLLGTQLALFLGAVPGHWGIKILLGLHGLGCLGLLFGAAMTGSAVLAEEGLGVSLDSREFWLVAGAVVLLALGAIGLLFTWSVAVVSPPSANRALPSRLLLAGGWLVTGATAALLAYQFRSPIPLYLWLILQVFLFGVQLLAAINEREQWGVRVARTIPRRWWLRGPAFLFYSGAAGGVLFAVTFLALSAGLTAWLADCWQPLFGSRFTAQDSERVVLVLVLVVLYAFDYCLTAVFVRYVLAPGRIKPLFTWVVALLLAAVGFFLPYIILYIFFSEDMRYGYISPWALITNPFATILEFALEYGRSGRSMRRGIGTVEELGNGPLWFAGGWAVLVTLLCLPWLVRQLRRFRPPPQMTR